LKRFIVISWVLTFILMVSYYALNEPVFHSGLHQLFPTLVFFFFAQSMMIAWTFYMAEKENWKNPIYILVSITFRFLTALFFALFLLLKKPEDIKSLMIQFVGLYLTYLIFELFAVLPNLRRN